MCLTTIAQPASRPGPQIRLGARDDSPQVVRLLVGAFLEADYARFLIPDLEERRLRYGPYFELEVDNALAHGLIYLMTTEDCPDGVATAVWYPDLVDGAPPCVDDYDQRLAQAVGPALPRFIRLHEAMLRRHPRGWAHDYLAFLAVDPDHQRKGYGSRLLQHHRNLDGGVPRPQYLEATGGNRAVYAGLGFHEDAAAFPVADGVPLLVHPMRR